MNTPLHLWLIPLLPFAGFLINGLLGSRLPKWIVTAVALLAPLGAFGVVLNSWLFARSSTTEPDLASVIQTLPYAEHLGHWINVGTLHIDFSLVLRLTNRGETGLILFTFKSRPCAKETDHVVHPQKRYFCAKCSRRIFHVESWASTRRERD